MSKRFLLKIQNSMKKRVTAIVGNREASIAHTKLALNCASNFSDLLVQFLTLNCNNFRGNLNFSVLTNSNENFFSLILFSYFLTVGRIVLEQTYCVRIPVSFFFLFFKIKYSNAVT